MMTTAQYLRQIENYDNRIKNKLIEEEQLSSLSTSVSAILQKRQEIVRTIEQVEDPLLYDILFKHYVEYKSLVRIADEMGYSEIHIKKKHLKAIAEIKKIKGFER